VCVFKLTEDKVVLVAACHVDNNAIAGAPHWMKWFKEGVKKRFGATVQPNLVFQRSIQVFGANGRWMNTENVTLWQRCQSW
jgi:hypothetical protein